MAESETSEVEHQPVIFVIPPCWGVDAPPNGAAYVSGFLQAHGVDCHVRDLNVELFHVLGPEHEHLWRQEGYRIWELAGPFYDNLLPLFAEWLDLVVRQIVAARPKVICFSINVASVIFSLHLTRLLKERIPGLRTIFGGNQCRFGVGASHLPPGLFGTALKQTGLVDAVVLGEGERTALDLVTRALADEPMRHIPGALTIEDGFFGNFLHQTEIGDLDKLGFPSFGGYPLESYLQEHLPVLLSRGCRYSCAFCNERLQFEGFRSRTGEQVFDEVAQHKRNYGSRLFHFCDLVINGDPRQLVRFAEKVVEEELDIVWTSQAVVHKSLTDPDNVDLLARSGCDHLIFGIESFSDKITKAMGKPYPPKLVDEVLANLTRQGVGSVINIIVGFPGETEVELEETIEGLRRNKDNISMVSSVGECLVSPGSILEQKFRDYGLVFPETDRFIHWAMPGNTHEVRLERMERVLEELGELGLGYYKTTRYDEALEQNIGEDEQGAEADNPTGLAFMPQMMSVQPDTDPDRGAAAYNFVSTSVEEATGPTAQGSEDIELGDPGWIMSPVTPMPHDYILLHGDHSQVRLGGRNVDLFFRGRLLSRGPGLMARIDMGDGKVLSTQAAIWSYARQLEGVLATCDFNDGAAQVQLFITMVSPDRYRVMWGVRFAEESDEPIWLQLGLCLHDSIKALKMNGDPCEPVMPYQLPPEAKTLSIAPAMERSPMPEVEIDLGGLPEGMILEHQHDMWIDENRFMLRKQIPRRAAGFPLDISVADRGVDSPWPRPPVETGEDVEAALAKDLELCRVRIMNRDGEGRPGHDTLYFRPGDSALVRLTIFCRRPVEAALLRLQLHDCPEGRAGRLVIGMNNRRMDHDLELRPGCFTEVTLSLDELHLAPACYTMSVILAAGEEHDSEEYDSYECAYTLEMVGDREEVTLLASPQLTLLPLAADALELTVESDDGHTCSPEEVEWRKHKEQLEFFHIQAVHPVGRPWSLCDSAGRGGEVLTVLRFGGERTEEDQALIIQLDSDGQRLGSWELPIPDGAEGGCVLHIERLMLLRGDCRLTVMPANRMFAGEQLTLHVRSGRLDGAGVIYCPANLTSRVLEPPPW